MIKTVTISLLPFLAADKERVKEAMAAECGVSADRLTGLTLRKQSIDGRSRQPLVLLQADVYIDQPHVTEQFDPCLRDVSGAPHVVIAGAGPAGMFAALRLITLGIKPIIIEQGKDVRNRRRDLAILNREGIVNPESNYCFGEGGAGTFSDGKLYTRSTKRGNVTRVLQLFHHFGAAETVLYESHPHIGTNKLPGIITAIREAIIGCGGEIRFETRLADIIIDHATVKGIVTAAGETIPCQELILATGHSARDIFKLLVRKGIQVECKPFALGVRIEHPQEIIDQVQYHCITRDPFLPPASYALVTQEYPGRQEPNRGIFSFCMCPGGIIAPAATAPGEVVVNGWSPSKRNNPFANSGTVVAVDEKDFAAHGFTGPLAAMEYQQMVEQRAYVAGGGRIIAPAQRMTDFVNGKVSGTLPLCSYVPGIGSVNLKEVLPSEVTRALKKALPDFGRKMKGYYTSEALMVATESRTSSPVRIPRHKDTLQHIHIKGLYPCAEGAGYAGGIISAAIDGERCAEAIAEAKKALKK